MSTSSFDVYSLAALRALLSLRLGGVGMAPLCRFFSVASVALPEAWVLTTWFWSSNIPPRPHLRCMSDALVYALFIVTIDYLDNLPSLYYIMNPVVWTTSVLLLLFFQTELATEIKITWLDSLGALRMEDLFGVMAGI